MQIKFILLSTLLTLSQCRPSKDLALASRGIDKRAQGESLSLRQTDPWANPDVECTGAFLDPNAPYVDNQNTLVQYFQTGGVIDDVWVIALDDTVFLSEAFGCRYGNAAAPSGNLWQNVWSLIDAKCNSGGQVGAGWARSSQDDITLGRTVYDDSIC